MPKRHRGTFMRTGRLKQYSSAAALDAHHRPAFVEERGIPAEGIEKEKRKIVVSLSSLLGLPV